MFDKAYGCACDAASIRRNVFFSYFHIDRITISELQNIKKFHIKRLCYILYL